MLGGHNERTNLQIVKKVISYLHDNVNEITENLMKYVEDRKGHDRRYGTPEQDKRRIRLVS